MIRDKKLLFIPMYNCERQITRVLDQLDCGAEKYFDEVIVVDNRSTDNSEFVVREYLDSTDKNIKISLLRNDDNYGLGGSHKVAFSYAMQNNYDYVVVLHGDDQGNLKDLLPHLDDRGYEEFDCLLGARFQKGSRLQGYSRFRTFGNIVYNLIFSVVTHKRIYDLGSGLNCYKVATLNSKYYQKFPDNLTFNYCMILASSYFSHSIKFFPISWREDDQISNVKLYSQAVRVLGLLYSYLKDKKVFLNSEHRYREIDQYTGKIIADNQRGWNQNE